MLKKETVFFSESTTPKKSVFWSQNTFEIVYPVIKLFSGFRGSLEFFKAHLLMSEQASTTVVCSNTSIPTSLSSEVKD